MDPGQDIAGLLSLLPDHVKRKIASMHESSAHHVAPEPTVKPLLRERPTQADSITIHIPALPKLTAGAAVVDGVLCGVQVQVIYYSGLR
jgi:hypothetical protein